MAQAQKYPKYIELRLKANHGSTDKLPIQTSIHKRVFFISNMLIIYLNANESFYKYFFPKASLVQTIYIYFMGLDSVDSPA